MDGIMAVKMLACNASKRVILDDKLLLLIGKSDVGCEQKN
jgi:hypothetical protein